MDLTARQRALRLILPAACVACETVDFAGPLTLGLCPRCRDAMTVVSGSRCSLCLRPVPPGAVPICGPCALRPPAYDRLEAIWEFTDPSVQIIHAFKFGRLEFLGRQLARAALVARPGLARGADAVVPVPLHWRRRMGRGFNQAAAFARPLAVVTRTPFRNALRRRRSTLPQSSIPSDRRARNVRGAFGSRHGAGIEGRQCLLVDDVVTTGETLGAAARALKLGGAKKVVALAAARTPGPEEATGACDLRELE